MIVALVMEVTTGLFTGAARAHGLLASLLFRVGRTDGKSLWNITKRCLSYVFSLLLLLLPDVDP